MIRFLTSVICMHSTRKHTHTHTHTQCQKSYGNNGVLESGLSSEHAILITVMYQIFLSYEKSCAHFHSACVRSFWYCIIVALITT